MESCGRRLKDGGVAQPLPALGLRPWFAFLRRARSLRRFAFAMGGRVPGTLRYRSFTSIKLRSEHWELGPVTLATTFRQRLIGMGSERNHSLLMHTGSVHGRGLKGSLRVFHLTRAGRFVGQDVLAVGRIVRARAYWILETPMAAPVPENDAQVIVLPSSPG